MATPAPVRMKCERCHRRYRQVLEGPLGPIVQDWFAPWPPTDTRPVSVAESDPDICTDCEQEVFDACEAAGLN